MESTTLKLITTANAAELLAVSETVAKKVLLRYGLHPVDYGPGRGRGLRWPYLGVLRVIEQMQTEATVKTVKATNKKKNPPFLSQDFSLQISVYDLRTLISDE